MAGGVVRGEGSSRDKMRKHSRAVVTEGDGSRKKPFMIVDEPLKVERDAHLGMDEHTSEIHYGTVKAEEGVNRNKTNTPNVVTVPNGEILKLVCEQMRLKVHDRSVLPQTDGMVRGLIRMDVPNLSSGGHLETKDFVGEKANASSDAFDSAARTALLFLVDKCDVIINDFKSEAAREAKRKEAIFKDYADFLSDMVTARDVQLSRAYDNLKDLFDEGKAIFMKFRDVLPVTLSPMDSSPSLAGQKLEYAGELFTLTMVEFMNTAASIDRMDPVMF